MMLCFGEWARQAVRTRMNYLEETCQRYKAKLGKMAESIWFMRKAELVEKVVNELGWNRADAEKEHAGQLRLYLREARTELSPASAGPKGLHRMKKDELIVQCDARGIVFDGKTREVMIWYIKQ